MLNQALIQKVSINFATTGDNAVVPAVAGKTIQVYGLVLVVTTPAVALTFKDGVGGTALTGPMTVSVGLPLTLGLPLTANSSPLFSTSSAANAFVIGQGAGTSQISGECYFIQN